MNVNPGVMSGGGIPSAVWKKLGEIRRYSIPSLFVVDGNGRCLSNVDIKLLREDREFSAVKILGVLGDWTPEAVKAMEKEKQ